MMASITGPIDTSAMDINVSVDPISLTLSPAVIRLILHAVKTLTPEKVEKKSIVPADLWDKKPLDPSKLWFFSPVQLHTNQAVVAGSSVEKKEESLILTVESIEVILESESTQKSQGHPVLAVNISAVLQASEFTGNFTAKADVQCEASYYNEHVSVWEPLLEPVEMAEGHLCPWNIMTEMKKGVVNEDAPEAKFSVSLSAQSPLQLTMTTTSLQLIKQLAVDCSREYGKKVEGSVKVQSLTGAPITVVNKLGSKFDVIVTPGPNMKLKDKSASARLSHGEDLDIFYLKNIGRRSHASLISRRTESKQTLNILVDGYQELCHVAVAHPGRFYFRLVPTNPSPIDSDCGLVLDIAVTGMKRTITVRSPIQFKNHTLVDLDLLAKSPFGGTKVERVAVLAPDETFSAPIDVAQTHEFFVKPSQPGFEPDLAPLLWLDDYPAGYRDFHCTRTGATQSDYFLRVTSTKETYKSKKTLPRQPFPHHTFDIYPPAVLRNLLPYNIIMMVLEVSHIIKAGEFVHLHDLELATEPVLKVTVIASEQEKLQGKIHLHKRLSEYSKFVATDGKTSNDLSVHVEDFHYRQVAIFSPFWMMNRTGLVLIYREGLLRCKHHPDKEIQLFSTKDPKSKIMLGAITPNKSVTEWTRNFSLNAVGTSGCFSAKLGESTYTFGVEVQLSSFTVTKLVVVTPYYLLVNETESSLHVSEVTQTMVSSPTNIPPGQLVPFWPLCNTNNVLVATDDGAKSIPFDYQKSDFTVLQLEGQLKVLCVEVQDSGSAKVVTFSSYYPGCVPVKIINHFPDITLKFSQDTRSPHAISHYLPPGESLLFTWEDPSGRRSLKWELVQARVNNGKSIDVSKDGQESFNIKVDLSQQRHSSMLTTGSRSSSGSSIGDPWIAVDKTYSESLVRVDEEDGEGEEYGSQVFSDTLPVANGDQRRESTGHASLATGGLVKRGYWKSFIDGLQRVVIFTCDEGVIDRIKAENSYSLPLFEVSLALKALGLSLVDNVRKRELAYIALTQSGLIWQINKGKGQWKTLNTALNSLLEEAYQRKEVDIKQKELAVNIETMEMFAPMTGALRRTHHDAVFFKFEISEKDISVHAKIGYVQVDNQLPFAVYPQVLYPLPPPPTVASTTEPKPFFEASIIMRRSDQSNVRHFKYVHVLVQKMAVNADLGFILALVDFFSLDIDPALLAAELVTNDIEIARKSLKEAVLPQLSKDLESSKNFFDLLHMAPLKITLSFNVRSVGRNKGKNESSVGDRFLQLFLHSLGIILTSVQEADMKFSCFHLEYQPLTGRGLQNYFVKHYRTQALFQLHTLIFGLDVLGNPVSVVKGLVEGTVDLFYEPFKGSVLGPEEFFEGLQIGLKSFLGGTLGGLTGAGAKITGAFGDVFAKLTFDDDFIDKRQVERTKAPRFGRKLGGFAKNLFEGVTGVVTQPVKGLEREGALGLLKGTGKGVAGFFIRPIGGLVDLTSGTLDVVTRKTQVGNIEIQGIRPPRYIGRNGVVVPYSPSKAVGTALLLSVDEGRVAESDYYQGHVQVSKIPHFVLVTDRQVMIVERRILTEGWKSVNFAAFADMDRPVRTKEKSVVISYRPEAKTKKLYSIELQSTDLAMEVAMAINKGYDAFETGDDC